MYNETTFLCGKEVTLTDKERESVELFHTSRVAFAFLPDGFLAVNTQDEREHRVYLREDYEISDRIFETLVRGYIKKGQIAFYVTSSFKAVDNIADIQVEEVCKLAVSLFGEGRYTIGNGVKVGALGEEWPFENELCVRDLEY